jgi:tripartite-type tricarboxylate transporter receptor subunit TctC
MHRVPNAYVACLSSMLAVLAVPAAHADAYPAKPLRFIVANAPGSSADILARIVGGHLAARVNQQVVVDVRPGGSGLIGTQLAAAAPPDGYTLLQAGNVFTTLAALRKSMPVDPDTAFIPLTKMAWVSNVLAVNAGIGVNSVGDLIRLARAQPGKLNFGSAGNGSPSHLSGALLNFMAGISTVHVPYRGTAAALTDIMSGELQFVISSPLVIMPHVNNPRIRVLATTGPRRDPLLPQYPTVAETLPGYEITQWWGVAVPARTPRAIVTRLHADIVAVLGEPETRAALAKIGATPDPQSPSEFAAFIRAERVRIADLATRAHIAIED